MWYHYSLSINKSIMTDLFQGQLHSEVICFKCGHKNHSFESFQILHIDIEDNKSVQECIEMSFLYVQLTGENKFMCNKCGFPTISAKCERICKFPTILIIHLKRFYSNGYHNLKKNNRILINGTLNFSSKGFYNYNLISTINHYGSLEGGHYVALCKDKKFNWYLFNDSSISSIYPLENTLSDSSYILFYALNSVQA